MFWEYNNNKRYTEPEKTWLFSVYGAAAYFQKAWKSPLLETTLWIGFEIYLYRLSEVLKDIKQLVLVTGQLNFRTVTEMESSLGICYFWWDHGDGRLGTFHLPLSKTRLLGWQNTFFLLLEIF